LAMYVVLQSALGMVCDYPEAYEGQPGFEFIKEVPTNWDETKVPDAKFREYVVVARRHTGDWYVGAINNHSARRIDVPLEFLGDGDYEAEIFSDAKDTNVNPNHLNQETKSVSKNDRLSIQLAAGGGVAIHFKRISK